MREPDMDRGPLGVWRGRGGPRSQGQGDSEGDTAPES